MSALRNIGRSGLTTPPLVLGGNVFGWTVEPANGFAILDAFVAGGGRMIDTSDFYSAWIPGNVGGESERVIGQWLHARGRRDDVLIATKVGHLPGKGGAGLTPERIAGAIEESLERLQTDYVDLYYVHRDRPAVPMEELLGSFDTLVKSGKVRAIAASNMTADRLELARSISAAEGLARFDAVEPLYNLVERDEFETTLQSLCLEHDLAVFPYFGLANGFLTGKYRRLEDLAGRARGDQLAAYFNPQGLRALAALDAVADQTGALPGQIALAWLAAQPGITAPIASATTVAQAEQLVASMNLQLTAAQLALLDAVDTDRQGRDRTGAA